MKQKREQLINKLSYLLLQTHFNYFSFNKKVNNLKVYKFLINFNYILFD